MAHRAKPFLWARASSGCALGARIDGGSAPRAMREVGDDPSPLTRGAGASAARARAGRWGPPGSGKARAQGQVELGRGAGLGLLLRCRAGCSKGLGQKLKWAKKRKEKN